MRMRSRGGAIPPSTDHTNGLSPCSSTHGWKWSEISANAKPLSSARRACSTSARGVCSSAREGVSELNADRGRACRVELAGLEPEETASSALARRRTVVAVVPSGTGRPVSPNQSASAASSAIFSRPNRRAPSPSCIAKRLLHGSQVRQTRSHSRVRHTSWLASGGSMASTPAAQRNRASLPGDRVRYARGHPADVETAPFVVAARRGPSLAAARRSFGPPGL